ncbi:MAG: hypothetical protein V1676_01240 [Candidatus Diapherotrites archaeon]
MEKAENDLELFLRRMLKNRVAVSAKHGVWSGVAEEVISQISKGGLKISPNAKGEAYGVYQDACARSFPKEFFKMANLNWGNLKIVQTGCIHTTRGFRQGKLKLEVPRRMQPRKPLKTRKALL